MTSRTLLIDFPAVVKSKVLEKLDIFSILKLRKVCYDLRQFIDEHPPKPRNTEIRLNLVDHAIEIELKLLKTKSVKFEQKKKMIFKDTNFIDLFLKEFEIIMSHHWRPILDSVKTEIFEKRYCSMLQKMLTKIGCFHTQQVVFQDCNPVQIGKILPFFDSKDLEKIYIEGFFEDGGDNDELEDEENGLVFSDLKDLIGLDQWKNASQVGFEGEYFFPRIQDFIDFSIVKIECYSVSYRDLAALKEMFLTTPTLTIFDIQLRQNLNDRSEINAWFGERSLLLHQFEVRVFRIPDSEDVLSLIISSEDKFLFQRIGIENIPIGAVIRD